jgi:hypothetical protein
MTWAEVWNMPWAQLARAAGAARAADDLARGYRDGRYNRPRR